MSETKWTPGPWSRVDTPDYAEIHAPGAKQAVALVGTAEDANLIAAAPDLYRALAEAVELIENCTPYDASDAFEVLIRARGEKP